MWHTSRGDRTLRGAEAALVGKAIDTMIDALLLHVDDAFEETSAADCQSGIAVYDSMSACQRVGLLYNVAKHLLTATESALPLSAAAEATVAAIFVEIRDQVAIEIDLFPDRVSDRETMTWRRHVLDAHEAVFRTPHQQEDGFVFDFGPFPEDIEIPAETCHEIHSWETLIEDLSDAVLWDRDFEMAEGFLDADPGVSQQRRRLLGIDEDYFTQVAPDPRPGEVFRMANNVREIVRAKPR
ncbi:MAG: hypothetical protein MI861_03780 [Pirellulales bacterium]|nr:hypothetical protein [Pirellulales bacterium]